jgi:GT2 family glycosyltransferase
VNVDELVSATISASDPSRTGASRSVVAIVVTYHAPDHLQHCIDAIKRQAHQVAAIFVVDNDETGTSGCSVQVGPTGVPWVHVIRPGQNLGPAGGFALGIHAAIEAGAHYVWMMDDDVSPAADCLAEQLEVMRRLGDGAVLLPAMYDRDSGTRRDTWGWCGLLADAATCHRIGLPHAELFWGFEDLDWIIDRTAAAGIPRARVASAHASVILRPTDAQLPSWKSYYYARNAVYLAVWGRRHIPAGRRMKRQLHHLHHTWKRAASSADPRRSRQLILRGIVDGVFRRLGRTVEPDHADRPISTAGNE